jgi:hypothetical protein
MMLDNQQVLSDAQALTATAVSTNKYDTGLTIQQLAGADMGVGFFVDVAADFTTGDETYTFAICSDADSALGSPTVHESRALLAAYLIAGAKFFMSFDPSTQPVAAAATERYLGVRYTLAGTSPSVTITAVLMKRSDFEVWRAYPNNISIS